MAALVIYLITILMLTLKPGEPKYSHINFQIDVVLNFNLLVLLKNDVENQKPIFQNNVKA